jgi:hypothetical protein
MKLVNDEKYERKRHIYPNQVYDENGKKWLISN